MIASRARELATEHLRCGLDDCSTATRTTRHYEAAAVVGPANNMLMGGTRSDYLGSDGQNELVR